MSTYDAITCCEDDASSPSPRIRLMDAGITLFTEKGYDGTSVREIVDLAGVSKPMLYYYFHSKRGIFETILDDAADQFQQILNDIQTTPGSVLDRLIHFSQHFYEGIQQHQNLYRMVHRVIFRPPGKEPLYDTHRFERSMVETIKRIYMEGMEKGEVGPANPEDIAVLVIGVIDSCFHIDFSDSGSRDPARPERLLRLAFDGLAGDCHKRRGEK